MSQKSRRVRNAQNMKLMKHDPLVLMRFLCSDIIASKWGKALMIPLLLACCFTVILHIYYYSQTFKMDFWFNYLPLISWALFAIIALTVFVTEGSSVASLGRDISLWSITNVEGKNRQEIDCRIRCNVAYTVIVTAFTFLAGFVVAMPKEDELQFNIAIQFFKEHEFHGYNVWLEYVYRFLVFPNPYFLIVTCYQSIYYLQHIGIQMYLLRTKIEDLNDEFESVPESQLYYDEDYQNEIDKKLMFFRVRYTEIIRELSARDKKYRLVLAFFAVGAISAGIGTIVYIYTNLTSGNYLSTSVVPTIYTYTALYLLVSGQIVPDESEQLVETLLATKWYTWNAKNKKNFQIILVMAMKVLRIPLTESVYLDYELGKMMLKAIVSVVTVLAQLRFT